MHLLETGNCIGKFSVQSLILMMFTYMLQQHTSIGQCTSIYSMTLNRKMHTVSEELRNAYHTRLMLTFSSPKNYKSILICSPLYCPTFVWLNFLWNTDEDFFKNVGEPTVFDFHYKDTHTQKLIYHLLSCFIEESLSYRLKKCKWQIFYCWVHYPFEHYTW